MSQESEPARESKQMPHLIKLHLKLASHIREEVKTASDKAAQKQSAIKNPPNMYDVCAEVLVRRFSSNSRCKHTNIPELLPDVSPKEMLNLAHTKSCTSCVVKRYKIGLK